MLSEEQMLCKLSEKGMRITDQRKTMIRLFTTYSGYLLPKDVYEHMEKKYKGISLDTIYRNLRVMHEAGVLEQVMFETGVKFRAHCAENKHHHHLICTVCHKTYPLVFCPMEMADIPNEFQVMSHKFEVFGYCKNCASLSP